MLLTKVTLAPACSGAFASGLGSTSSVASAVVRIWRAIELGVDLVEVRRVAKSLRVLHFDAQLGAELALKRVGAGGRGILLKEQRLKGLLLDELQVNHDHVTIKGRDGLEQGLSAEVNRAEGRLNRGQHQTEFVVVVTLHDPVAALCAVSKLADRAVGFRAAEGKLHIGSPSHEGLKPSVERVEADACTAAASQSVVGQRHLVDAVADAASAVGGASDFSDAKVIGKVDVVRNALKGVGFLLHPRAVDVGAENAVLVSVFDRSGGVERLDVVQVVGGLRESTLNRVAAVGLRKGDQHEGLVEGRDDRRGRIAVVSTGSAADGDWRRVAGRTSHNDHTLVGDGVFDDCTGLQKRANGLVKRAAVVGAGGGSVRKLDLRAARSHHGIAVKHAASRVFFKPVVGLRVGVFVTEAAHQGEQSRSGVHALGIPVENALLPFANVIVGVGVGAAQVASDGAEGVTALAVAQGGTNDEYRSPSEQRRDCSGDRSGEHQGGESGVDFELHNVVVRMCVVLFSLTPPLLSVWTIVTTKSKDRGLLLCLLPKQCLCFCRYCCALSLSKFYFSHVRDANSAVICKLFLQHSGFQACSGNSGATWANSHAGKVKPCRARCALPSAISVDTMTKQQLPRAATGKVFT